MFPLGFQVLDIRGWIAREHRCAVVSNIFRSNTPWAFYFNNNSPGWFPSPKKGEGIVISHQNLQPIY